MLPLQRQIEQRGFLSRFPQYLLQVDYWLPFERDFIIEDVDWNQKLSRFGSTSSLLHELDQLAPVLRNMRNGTSSAPLLDQALTCCTALCLLTRIAVEKKLPLWRTT